MDLLTGAFHIVAAVIGVGGAAKLAAPDAFAQLLRSLGLPSRRLIARVAGVAEVVLAALALVVGGPALAAMIGVTYTVFALVIVVARRRGAASCGCFGASTTPPGIVHLVLNVGSASVAFCAAAFGAPSLLDTLAAQPIGGVAYLLSLATGTWLVVALDTVGAQLVDEMATTRGTA